MSLFLNGIETNTVMLNGVETTGVWNGEVVWGVPPFKTLTLYHSEGGTLTANELTGYPGDTINLSTAYNTYWRFSGYQLTGDGTLANNTYTFGDEDATICACYKKNAFTANGNFEKGSNATYQASIGNTTTGAQNKYGVMTAHTGDIPASWYSTSNRWNPSNASAYNLAYTGKMVWTGANQSYSYNVVWVTATMYVGSTTYNQQTWKLQGTNTFSYSKTGTSTVQGNLRVYGNCSVQRRRTGELTLTYVATGTNGTWTATGYAP